MRRMYRTFRKRMRMAIFWYTLPGPRRMLPKKDRINGRSPFTFEPLYALLRKLAIGLLASSEMMR